MVNRIEDDSDTHLLKIEQYSQYGVLVKVTQEEANFKPFDFSGLFPGRAASKTYKGLAFARFRLEKFLQKSPFLLAQIEILTDEISPAAELELSRSDAIGRLKGLACQYLEMIETRSDLLAKKQSLINEEKNPNKLVFNLSQQLDCSTDQKLQLLQANDIKKRALLLESIMSEKQKKFQLAKELESKVRTEVEGDLAKKRLETPQMPGGFPAGRSGNDLDELLKKIRDAKLPPAAHEEVMKEFDRLAHMQQKGSQEAVVSRTYIELVADLPWSISTTEDTDLKKAEVVLNRDHSGLQKVKSRIIEYLAVRLLKGSGKGSIICLVGPPGVGKTSLGKSIAESLNRKFARISLGGIKDEAEIRGHRRTYVGALPGVIISTLKKCRTKNPVILLDEIDKVSRGDVRGDPSSALLEVLDPAQNDTFTDHYLGIPFDLSSILFIVTANTTETIQPPLLDRLEVINIPGYTFEEKKDIAARFLVPKLVSDTGLSPAQIGFAQEALDYIIKNYTSEPGVRSLARCISQICRHVAVDYTMYMQKKEGDAQETAKPKPFAKRYIQVEHVKEILGVEVNYLDDIQGRINKPGIAIGLAWTPSGGKVLIIESSFGRGKGRIEITGQLGDVMKESVKTGLGWIRSNLSKLELDNEKFITS